jgi:hypothetical protein
MTVTAKCLVEAKQAENAQTTQYTTPAGTRTIVDKFSARSVAGATLSVNIVASGGAAGASNLIVTKTLAAGEQYTFPELVGQVLNAGDFISTISSVATDTVIRISGRENT